LTWVEKGALSLIVSEARLPVGGGRAGRVGWTVAAAVGPGVGVSPGRGVLTGGSDPHASITIRKITIHTRRIDKLYQGKKVVSFQSSVISKSCQLSGIRCQVFYPAVCHSEAS
jgi:hypothetical protein